MTTHPISVCLQRLHRAVNEQDTATINACFLPQGRLVAHPFVGAGGNAPVADALANFTQRFIPGQQVSQGDDVIIEAGDVALVHSKLYLTPSATPDALNCEVRKALYVFMRDADGEWKIAIDNFFGQDVLDYC